MNTFDPNAAAGLDTLFGLPAHPRPAVSILPVPFDATTSFRPGTAGCGPWVREASQQVDLHHPVVEEAWKDGIELVDPSAEILALNEEVHPLVAAVRAGSGSVDAVNAAGDRVAEHVYAFTKKVLDDGRVPGILGGDHSVPLGAFRAASERYPGMGILHIDAHADLRDAYEGFTHSHASIFHNALSLDLGAIVQIGIRDRCDAEADLQDRSDQLQVLTDAAIADAVASGVPIGRLFGRAVARLPDEVWISFDVDGLDPTLCPATGTPVPGGLSWREVKVLLRLLGTSGRRIVGFDLCEVGADAWDANVGARLLFALSCWSIHTRRSLS